MRSFLLHHLITNTFLIFCNLLQVAWREKSMDDFWVYDSITEDKRRLLSHSTSQEQSISTPGARSCHKMVFDSKTVSIYLLKMLNNATFFIAPAARTRALNQLPRLRKTRVGWQLLHHPTRAFLSFILIIHVVWTLGSGIF